MTKIIGFTGKMGVGKSTAIQQLRVLQPNPVKLFKFAQPLYDIQEYAYQIVSPAYRRPENFIKDRKLLQWLGTEWGRGLNENIWVDLWKFNVQDYQSRYPRHLIVCDDVRFDNEGAAIKALGGHVIQLISDKSVERIDTVSGISNHASEKGIDNKYIERIITNNGTIEELKDELWKYLRDYNG